jgi:uncharacterized membrane protein (UPF0127 family)
MKTVRIFNINNGAVLADQAVTADKFLARLKGLIGKRSMDNREALVITPCTMVHCFGMKINIDVLFVNKGGQIIKIIAPMHPGQISPCIRKARYVVELPAGQAAHTGTKEGDYIRIDADSADHGD